MDCNYWSCYVHEDERLLIGGLSPFSFETIRNIAQSENYTQFIKVLNILDQMVKGVCLAGIKPCSDDAKCLREMINVEIGIADQTDTFVPKYVQALFHHFLMKKTEIMINLDDLKDHFVKYYEDWDFNAYGYRKFAKVLGYDHNSRLIDFNLFIKLFPNLIVFTFGDFQAGPVQHSTDLSFDFVLKIFECIEYLQKSSKALSFCRFEIVKPKSSINSFIQSMKDQFEVNGWKLKNVMFVGKGKWSHLESTEMLVIEKMSN